MVSLAGHLQIIESEKQKLRSQVRRLCQENAWLRDELADTQQRLQQSEQQCVMLDEERTHLQFMNEMRKYDPESSQQVPHLIVVTHANPVGRRVSKCHIFVADMPTLSVGVSAGVTSYCCYPRQLGRSAWVGYSPPSVVCLFVCLAFFLQHNSIMNDPKVFKLGVGTSHCYGQLLKTYLFNTD